MCLLVEEIDRIGEPLKTFSSRKSIDSAFLSSIIYKPLSNGYYIFETVKKQKEDNSSYLHKEQGEQKVRKNSFLVLKWYLYRLW